VSEKPLTLRTRARRDVDDAVGFYLLEAGDRVAEGFVDDLQRVLDRIAERPASGSPRPGVELSLPDLRSMRLRDHPHLVFYLEREDHIDVWRILHGPRDIPANLSNDDETGRA